MNTFNIILLLIFANLQFIYGQNSIYCVDPHTGLHYPVNSTWPSSTFCGSYSCNAKLVAREGTSDKYDSVPTLAENRTQTTKEEEDSFKEASEIQTHLKKYIENANNRDNDESDKEHLAKRANVDTLIELYKAVQILTKTIEKTEYDLGIARDELARLNDTTATDSSNINLNNLNHIHEEHQHYLIPESINTETIEKNEDDLDRFIAQQELAELGEITTAQSFDASLNNFHHNRGEQQYDLSPESHIHKTTDKTEADLDIFATEDLARLEETTTADSSDTNLIDLSHNRGGQDFYLTSESIDNKTVADLDIFAKEDLSKLGETAITDSSDTNLINLSLNQEAQDIDKDTNKTDLTPKSISNETLEKTESDFDTTAEKESATYSNLNNLNHIHEEQQYNLIPKSSNHQTIRETAADSGIIAQDTSERLEKNSTTDSSDTSAINPYHVRERHQYYLTPESINQTLEKIYNEYNEFLNKYSTLLPQYLEDSQCNLNDFEGSNNEDCRKPPNALISDADNSASENYPKYNNFDHSNDDQTVYSESQDAPQIYSTNFQNYPGYFYHGLSQRKPQVINENSCSKSNLDQGVPSTVCGESSDLFQKKEDIQTKLTSHDYLTQIFKHSPYCKMDQTSHEIIKKSSPGLYKSDYNTKIEHSHNSSQDSSSNLSVSYYKYDPSQGKYVIKVPKDMEEYEKFLQEYTRVYNLTHSSPGDKIACSEKNSTSSEPAIEIPNKSDFDTDNSETKKTVLNLNEERLVNQDEDSVKVLGSAGIPQIYKVPTFEYKLINPYEDNNEFLQENFKKYANFNQSDDAVQVNSKHYSLPTMNEPKERKNDIFSKLGIENDEEVTKDDDLGTLRSRLLAPRLTQRGLTKIPRIPRVSSLLIPSNFRSKRSPKPQLVDDISEESDDKVWKAVITVEGCPETLEPGKFKNGESEKHYPACCPQKINE